MNTSKLFDLQGKTAIVTGGANGIGKASCRILAAYGLTLWFQIITWKTLKKLPKKLMMKVEKPSP